MGLPFVLRLAWREGRGTLRKTWIHALAVALGVGALVAVHGFRADARRGIQSQARTLLGADFRLHRRDPLPDSVAVLVDSLVAAGARSASVVTVPSMVMATGSQTARLFQVRSVDGAWPFYGELDVDPPGSWPPAPGEDGAWVDPSVLIQLDAAPGDTLLIGEARVPVRGTVRDFPGEFGFQAAVGPPVFVTPPVLERARLLGFGSLVRYEWYLATEDETAPDRVREDHGELIRATGTGLTTARGRAESLSDGLSALSRYLGVVGLAALLLGGIGVASAVHVFVRSRLTSVAVLRCLGATRRRVLAAYLIQSVGVGAAGSLLGAAGGVALQLGLPALLGDLLPVDVTAELSWAAVVIGVAAGLGVTAAFSLGPLLPLRHVPPLRALRRDFETERSGPDPMVWAARAVLGALVVGLSVLEAPGVWEGLAIAGGLGAVLVVLWLLALGATRAVRRYFPRGLSYPVRQGVSNLFRPRNQTVPVVLALGVGVFVVVTLVELERNLNDTLTLDVARTAPNVLLFDIQPDQLEGVEEVVRRYAADGGQSSPLVPARLTAIDGVPAGDLMADTTEGAPARWALRREYRHTYRADPIDSETLVQGEWWGAVATPGAPVPISVEQDLAESLRLELGTTVTWSLGGREMATVVRSLRAVDWARFQPNSYVVFPPDAIERAPHTWVNLARVRPDSARARLQRDVALTFANVSVLDLARVQEALDGLLGIVRRIMGFLAVFSSLAGGIILAGAVAVTRSQRMRESALLKTLGARRETVLRVLLVEYLALGSLAAAGAGLLALASAWGLTRFVFEIPFRLHPGPAAAVVAAVTGLALVAGLAGSRGILSQPPLKVLRDLSE